MAVRRRTKTEKQAAIKPEVIANPIVPPSDLAPNLPAISQPAGELVSFDDKAKAWLATSEYDALKKYITAGNFPIHTETAMKFFELFLNGYDCKEIQRLNPAFRLEMILWAKVQYNWVTEREKYLEDLRDKIREKMVKTQLETSNFMADMLTAASRKYGNKIKKYLQTGDESDLGGTLEIESIHQLVKLVEGLQKVTGQDNVKHVKTTEEKNINVSLGTGTSVPGSSGKNDVQLTDDESAQLLKLMASAKRRHDRGEKE